MVEEALTCCLRQRLYVGLQKPCYAYRILERAPRTLDIVNELDAPAGCVESSEHRDTAAGHAWRLHE